MKRTFNLFLVLVFTGSLSAQCPTGMLNSIQNCLNAGAIDFNPAVWTLQGNTATNPGSHFIGTSDLKDFVFKTNSQERMRLTSNGNLGIGITVPAELLDVNGKARIRNLTGGLNNVLVTASSPDGVLNSIPFTGNALDVLLGNGTFGAPPGDDWGAQSVSTNSTLLGNGTTGNELSVHVSADGGNQVTTGGDGGLYVPSPAQDADWFKSGTTVPPTAIGEDKYTMGKVGIGTANPVKPLSVSLNVANTDFNTATDQIAFRLQNTNPNPNNLLILDFAYGDALFSNVSGIGARFLNITPGSENGDLFIWTRQNGTAVQRLTVKFNGRVGIGTVSPNEQLHVVGNVLATGAFITSDKRFKKDIQPLEGVMQKIQKLEGVSYQFRTEEFKERGFTEANQIGLIAQNVEEVYPELVKTYEDGYKAVNYDGLIPVLLEGMKEQQQTIENLDSEKQELTEEVTALQGRLDNLESKMNQLLAVHETQQQRINYQEVHLSNRQQIILNQNDPNPFSERTSITYFLPEGTEDAELFIHDTNGRILKRVALTSGDGIVEVFASNLSSGLYTYSIVVEGKVVETKKMLVGK